MKLPQPAEVCLDHPFVKCAALAIVGRFLTIEWMFVRKQDGLDAGGGIRDGLHLEEAVIRLMLAEQMERPARHGKLVVRARVDEMLLYQSALRREDDAIGQRDLTGGTRDHGGCRLSGVANELL